MHFKGHHLADVDRLALEGLSKVVPSRGEALAVSTPWGIEFDKAVALGNCSIEGIISQSQETLIGNCCRCGCLSIGTTTG